MLILQILRVLLIQRQEVRGELVGLLDATFGGQVNTHRPLDVVGLVQVEHGGSEEDQAGFVVASSGFRQRSERDLEHVDPVRIAERQITTDRGLGAAEDRAFGGRRALLHNERAIAGAAVVGCSGEEVLHRDRRVLDRDRAVRVGTVGDAGVRLAADQRTEGGCQAPVEGEPFRAGVEALEPQRAGVARGDGDRFGLVAVAECLRRLGGRGHVAADAGDRERAVAVQRAIQGRGAAESFDPVHVGILHRHDGAAAAVAEGGDRLQQGQRGDLVADSAAGERCGGGNYGHLTAGAVVRHDHALVASVGAAGDLDREEQVGVGRRVVGGQILQRERVGAASGGSAGDLSGCSQVHASGLQQRRKPWRGGSHTRAAPLEGDRDGDVLIGERLAISAEEPLDQVALHAGAGDGVHLQGHDLHRVGVGDCGAERSVAGLGLDQRERIADQESHQTFGAGLAGFVGSGFGASAAGTISPDGRNTYSPLSPWCS